MAIAHLEGIELMLQIRPDQIKVLARPARKRFASLLVRHWIEELPAAATRFGQANLMDFAERVVESGAEEGMTEADLVVAGDVMLVSAFASPPPDDRV